MPALCLAILASGCRAGGYVLRQDPRLSIVSPRSHEEITLPLVVRWQATGFRVTGPDGQAREDAGYFALFVDRSPIAPGEDLRVIARRDEPCLRTPGCPNESYLNQRNVYTAVPKKLPAAFTLEGLSDTRPEERPSAVDKHEVTIVLLDGRGRRIGEAYWSVEFTVDRSHEPAF